MDYEQKQPLTDGTALAEFRQKLPVDYKLYWHDVLAAVAHAKMLGETGIIAKEEAERINDGLIGILADVEKARWKLKTPTACNCLLKTNSSNASARSEKNCVPRVAVRTSRQPILDYI